MGAAMLKTPELVIDEKEAKMLCDAIQEVNAAYDLPMISPKTMAMIDLTMALGAVYGPRVITIMAKSKPKGPQLITQTQQA